MSAYDLLLLAHLVLFAYWLGGDLGVFYASRYVADPALTREQRATAFRIMAWLDEIPRICLVLILPVGVSLASFGYMRLSAPGLALVWATCLAWLTMLRAIHRYQDSPPGKTLRRMDMVLRGFVIITLAGIGLMSVIRGAPVAHPWLAAKMVVFAGCVVCGLVVRLVTAPFGPAFTRLVSEGSTSAVETRITMSLARARPFVVMIWILLIVAGYLGVAKPYFE